MLRFIAFGLLVSACSGAEIVSQPTTPTKNPESADSSHLPSVESGESPLTKPVADDTNESGNEDIDPSNPPVAANPNDVVNPDPTEQPVNNPAPTPEPAPAPTPAPPPQPTPSPAVKVNLTLPSQALRAGGQNLQPTARLEGTTEGRVIWSMEGPGNVDFGSLTSDGTYRSPANLNSEIQINIAAQWDRDNTNSTRVKLPLRIVPKNQNFVACGNSPLFPINAAVYRVPIPSMELPDFSTLGSSKIGDFCMDGFNIEEREWSGETPNLTDVGEWFGMRAEVRVNIPNGETYNFRLTADDGAKLYVDDKVVVDLDGLHPVQTKDGRIFLRSGSHKIVIDWYQGTGHIALQLLWKPDSQAEFTKIPTSSLTR